MIDGTPIASANTLTGLLDQRYPGTVIDLPKARLPERRQAALEKAVLALLRDD